MVSTVTSQQQPAATAAHQFVAVKGGHMISMSAQKQAGGATGATTSKVKLVHISTHAYTGARQSFTCQYKCVVKSYCHSKTILELFSFPDVGNPCQLNTSVCSQTGGYQQWTDSGRQGQPLRLQGDGWEAGFGSGSCKSYRQWSQWYLWPAGCYQGSWWIKWQEWRSEFTHTHMYMMCVKPGQDTQLNIGSPHFRKLNMCIFSLLFERSHWISHKNIFTFFIFFLFVHTSGPSEIHKTLLATQTC